jgi:hypothetical protein
MNRKIYATLFILFAFVTVTKSQTKIKDGTVTGTSNLPNSASILELESSNKGLLLPRVALTNTRSWGLAGSPVAGMVVYDTTTAITSSDNNYPILPAGQGEYYWDGTGWVAMKYTGTGWSTTGNSGTNPVSNFLGTTDNSDLVFRTNNTEQMRVLADGTLGIGTALTKGVHFVDSGESAILGASNFDEAAAGGPGTRGVAYMMGDADSLIGNVSLNTVSIFGNNSRVKTGPSGGTILIAGNSDSTDSGGFGASTYSIIGNNNRAGSGQGYTFFLAGYNNKAPGGGHPPSSFFMVGNNNTSLGASINTSETTVFGNDNYFNPQGFFDAFAPTIFGNNNYAATATGSSGTFSPMVFGSNDTVKNTSAFIYGNGINYSGDTAVILGYNAPTVAVLPNGNVGVGTTTPSSTLQANGSFSLPIKSITSAYTVTNADYKIVVRTTGTDTTLITLPNPTTCPGRIYIIQNMNPNIHFNTTGAVAFNYPIDIGAGYTISAGTPMLYTIIEQSPSAISGSGIVLQSDGNVWTGLQQ